MWRIISFIVGFGVSTFIVAKFIVPRGVLAAILSLSFAVACGVVCALYAGQARSKWWELDKWLRLTLFACLLWFLVSVAYFWPYDLKENSMLVFSPIIVLLAAYFGYKHFVEGPKDRR